MATRKNRQSAAAEIDWYLISIDRLKQIGLVVVLLLLGGAGYWFWQSHKDNPKSAAESAISEARQSLNALASSAEFNTHRAEFNRAQQKLDEANKHLVASRFVEAQGAAVESHTISRTALSGGADVENDAQFLTVEGDVQYQKAASSEWRDADPRTPLFNGDWVKTGGRASAELMFANGTLYTVGPNALLEIYAAVAPGSNEKTNSVTMKVGSVEIETSAEASSTVRTPGTQVVVESKSATQVEVDKASQETAVTNARGAVSVTPNSGGAAVRLAAGERVNASPQGALSQVKKLTPAPLLLSPGDNQVLQLAPGLQVEMLWEAQATATAYMLQVSRSRLFSTQEINSRREKTSAKAGLTEEGAFYWRVASIGPDGETGPFSPFRKFRVVGGGRSSINDKVPPKLSLKAPFHVGGPFFTISGSTEPGASVFINEEEVDVESNGTFQKVISFGKVGRNDVVVKAIDAAGNQTVQSQTVNVAEE